MELNLTVSVLAAFYCHIPSFVVVAIVIITSTKHSYVNFMPDFPVYPNATVFKSAVLFLPRQFQRFV